MRRRELDAVVADAWGSWVADMGEWHVFGALTYDPKRRRTDGLGGPIAPGADVVRAHIRSWIRDSQRQLGRELEAAVVAVEHHKSGWPHAHPLVRVAGGLQGNEFATLGQAWFREHGYARLEQPRDRSDVCAYAAKYLAKDLSRGDVVLWPFRGSLSQHQVGLEQLGAGHH